MTMTESPASAHYDDPAGVAELSSLVPDVEATVRRWLEYSQTLPVDKAAAYAQFVEDLRAVGALAAEGAPNGPPGVVSQ